MIHQPVQYYVVVTKIVIMKTVKKLGEMFMNIYVYYLNKAKYKIIYKIMIIMCINMNTDTHPHRSLSSPEFCISEFPRSQ